MQTDVAHPVALALSGGGDSMSLLRIAAAWVRTRGRRLLAITIDHGLNPASADWGRTCASAAASLGVDWTERRWEGAKPTTGLTAAARAARHALIAEAAREAGARVVLMAHTADDIAEADWMRAVPVEEGGSTLGRLRDWSPSPAWPEGRCLMLLRPMLEERREVLRAFLRSEGQGWIEDPGNADERFGRSRARRVLSVLPARDGGSKGVETAGPVSTIGRQPLTLSHQDDDCATVRSSPLPLGEGFRVGRTIAGRELAAVLLCASGRSTPLRGERLERLAARVCAGEDFHATLSGARIDASGDKVLIGREPGELKRRAVPDLLLEPGWPSVWDGRYEITAREPGWIATAAAGKLNRLSDADRAIVKTVPVWARPALPVLFRDGTDAPVLAWREAEVRTLAPRRLCLAQGGVQGEMTQEAELFSTIHGETPPTDLFSFKDHHHGAPQGPSRDREP